VIPPGSYVQGTVTQVKRPGRVKGRGELFVRFDSLTLPNGVTRDFRARVAGIDGRGSEELDREEGKIRSEGNKGGDARTIGEAAGAGASIGTIAGGASSGHYGMGAGIGAAAGAAAGLVGVLLSRGPDAILAKGSTVEMVLDRPLQFTASEIEFGPVPSRRSDSGSGPAPSQKQSGLGVGLPGRRF
jgi:type IV secretion system protein VirB10